MSSNIVRVVIWGSVAVAVAAVFYFRTANGKVNGLINEANALVDEGDAKRKEYGSETEQLLGGAIPRECFTQRTAKKTTAEDEFLNGPAPKELALDRAKLEKSVAKTDDLLAEVATNYRTAAAKFDEARKIGNSGVVSKYLELMSQACAKLADAEETRRKAVALVLDKSIASASDLHKQQNALFKGAAESENEFERLQADAEKLHDDNKSKFN